MGHLCAKIAQKSIRLFTSQMKVYFGYRSLLLNITDEKSEALVFKPIKTHLMGW